MEEKNIFLLIIIISISLLGFTFFVNINGTFSFLADSQFGEPLFH